MRTPSWYIENSLTPPKSFFEWCYAQIHTFKWSNKNQTILASDRTNCPIIEKRLTKNSRLTFSDKFYSFCIVLVSTRRIEIQSYGFWSNVKDGIQTIEMELIGLERLSDNKHIEVGSWWNGYYFGLAPLVPMGGPYTGITYYKNNWQEKARKISELNYLDWNQLDNPSLHKLPHLYKYKEEIEFLQKINARAICRQLIDNSIDMRSFSKKWLHANKQFIKNSDRTFEDYEFHRRIKQRGGKVVPGIEKYLNYKDIGIIPKKARMINFQNWIIKNKVDIKYYRDYLGLLKDLSVTIDNDHLITPKDLTKAHDNAVKLYNELEIEIKEKQNQKRLTQLKRLETTIGDYAFVAPKDLNELIVEGKVLRHCVGGSGYVEGHRKGETTIIFVRHKDSPNEPYYTMEYKNKKISQLRGKLNSLADNDLRKVADKWLTWVQTKPKKKLAA